MMAGLDAGALAAGAQTAGAALLALALFFAAAAWLDFSRKARAIAPVPGPKGHWLLGNLAPLLDTSVATWDTLNGWLDDTGEGIMRWRILNNYWVAVSKPEDLKKVMQTHMKSYSKELGFSFSPFMPILGSGLVTANGKAWQDQRVHLGPALRVDILDDIVSIAYRAAGRLTEKLEAAKGTGQPINMEEEFRLLTLQVICEAILSLPPEESDKVFPELYLPVMTEANKRVLERWRIYLPTPSWFQFHWRMAQLNSYITKLLRKRWAERQAGERQKSGQTDILDRVMEGFEKRGEKWTSALETHLCYQMKTFLLAGHETSAAMLTFSLYELTQNDDVMKKVQEEAKLAFGADDAEPSRDAADAMQYTLATLKETLRKYSVVPVVTREADVDGELCGYVIPKGTLVACHIQATHKLWKAPEAFSPDRFLPGGEYDGFEESIRPFMFVPFTQGPRNCLGQHLALLEARVVLAALVHRFKFRRARDGPLRRHPTIIPVGPEDGMDMYVS